MRIRKMNRVTAILVLMALFLSCFPTVANAYQQGKDGMGPVIIQGGRRDFLWPVPGHNNIQSCFYDQREHYAIDISAPQNTSVVASYVGTVIEAVDGGTSYYGDGFGNYVVLQHSYALPSGTITLYTRYSHLNSVSVKKGAVVQAGSEVGKVGTTGASTGYHLDFQILYGGWRPYKTYSIDPYANQLLELPSNLVVKDAWACGSSYYALVKELYAIPLEPAIIKESYPSHCTIKTTEKTTYIKSLPCSEKTDPNSANVEIAQKNTAYEAIGLCLNTAGNLWYKVKAKNGETGYMYAGDTEFVELLTDDVAVNGVAAPTELKEGSVFSIKGTIESRCQTITKVSAWVENSEGEEKTGDSALVITQYYDLHNSEVDMGVRFNDLPADKNAYTYYIGVTVESCYAESATVVGVKQKRVILHKSDFYVRGDAVCDHAYSGDVTAEAGCTTGGTKTFTCGKCGHSYTEAIAPLGHSFTDYRDDNNATCTAEGTKTAKCDRCSATDTVKAGYTLGHHCRHEVTIKPTESTAGILTTTCTGCGAEWTDSLPKLSNEEYSYQVIVEPDAYNEGIGRYTWKNTDHGEVAFQVAIPKLEENPAKADIIIKLGDVSGKAEETVRIPITVDSKTAYNSIAIYGLTYDTSRLAFVGFENYQNTANDATLSDFDSNKGTITLGYNTEVTRSGKICDAVFVIKENAQNGEQLEVSASAIVKLNADEIPAEIKPATVSVRTQLLGDIDGNGVVDINDALLLFQHSMVPDIYPITYEGNVDFDKNGVLDINDCLLLFQYSMLPDLYPIS